MIDPRSAGLWGFRGLFLALVALSMFLRLLPLSVTPESWPLPGAVLAWFPDWLHPYDWPGADWLLCLTVVWLLRRPDFVPALVVAGVFFVDDLLTMRPPGLWALIVLASTEFLRARENATRDLPFLWEWLMAGAAMAMMMLAYWLLNGLFMIPQVGVGVVLLQLFATVLLYPFLAFGLEWALGLRRAAKGEIDMFGQRL